MLNAGGFSRSEPHTLVVNNAIKDTRPVSHPSSRGTEIHESSLARLDLRARSFPCDSYAAQFSDIARMNSNMIVLVLESIFNTNNVFDTNWP